MINYSKHLINFSQWLIVGLIILLWVSFFLNSDNQISDLSISSSNKFAQQNISSPTNIAQYHIFGSAQKLYDVPISQTQSNLDLILNGTMSNIDKSSGMAYISNVQGVQKNFKVGDKVFDLAILKEVHTDHVILAHNGRNERLALLDDDVVVTTTQRKNKKAANTNQKPTFLKHLNGSQQKNWQDMVAQQKFDPAKISNIVSNINMVTDQSGAIQGLRVSNLAQGSALKKHGLKSNDIITEVNGKKITGKNMLTIKQTLTQNPNANITIKRNGKLQNIQVNLSDL